MPDPTAVLFDLDGVLVDSCEAWFQLVRAAAQHFRTPDVSRPRFDACWGQGIEADLREFFPGCDAACLARYYADHLLDFDSHIRVEPGARELLCSLRDAEFPRGVVTNTPTSLARDILAWAGLIGIVDVTMGAEPHLAAKPAPDMLLLACNELRVAPQQVLVVGDSRFDAQAAAAAQAQFLGFRTSGAPAVHDLEEIGARLLKRRG